MGQRATRRGLKPLIILAATVAATASAHAEQLVMPFACDARGGAVRLYPTDERAYTIYGRREHHVFTVCSPTDPNRCLNWRIHRFDVDCGGERVSWLRVAEAARRFTRTPAFVEAGTMHLTIAPVDRRWARRAGRFDGPEETVIDLPPGFAPTFGLAVSFQGGPGPSTSFDAVEGPPPAPEPYGDEDGGPGDEVAASHTERRYAQSPAGSPYDRDYDDGRYGTREASDQEFDRSGLPLERPAPKVQAAPVEKGWEPEKLDSEKRDSKAVAAPPQKSGSTVAASSAKATETGKTVAKSDVAKVETSKVETSKVETPKVETPKVEAAKPEAPKSAVPKAEVAAAPPPKPAVPPTPPGVVTPTILNAPGAEKPPAPVAATRPVEAPPPTVTPAPEKSSPPPPAPQAAAHDEPRVATPEAPAKPPETPAKSETAIPVIGLAGPESSAFAPWHWMAFAGGAALLTVLSSLLLMRRNTGYDVGLPRDIGVVSLSGAPVTGTSLVQVSEPGLPGPALEASPPDAPPAPPSAEIHMPTTLSEALQVVGASADAEPGVVKKIVEGLRQSWHPDLARSNRDRRYREQRMAQINVAWDIIAASLRPAA